VGRSLVRAVVLVALCGCSAPSPEPAADAPARRIVSVAPPITEILFALGRGDRVVGRSRFCEAPPEARSVPVVGDAMAVQAETLVALRPDLVLTSGRGLEDLMSPLRDRMRVLYLRTDSLDDLFAAVETLGRLAEAEEEAAALGTRLRAVVDEAWRRNAHRARPRVLVVVNRDPFFVAGGGSYVGSLLDLAGAENVAGDLPKAYPSLSPETILARAPAILLDGTPAANDEETRAYWSRFPDLPAVKNGRVHALQDLAVVQPGPRLEQAIRSLEDRIHGEEGR
jgi:iron complex transport system substrate-binding protein